MPISEKQRESTRARQRAWREKNRESLRDRQRAWYAAHPGAKKEYSKKYRARHRERLLVEEKATRATAVRKEQQRAWNLKRHYGLTQKQWNALFDAQGRCCAICKSDSPRHRHGWSTDHCHETGRVRGILCMRCNIVLGYLGDSAETVDEAHARIATYLKGGD